jgi:PhnB protein
LRWIFAALSAGGKVDMPMSDAFRGSYFGLFTDKFGIQWMGSYEKPPVKLIKEVCS